MPICNAVHLHYEDIKVYVEEAEYVKASTTPLKKFIDVCIINKIREIKCAIKIVNTQSFITINDDEFNKQNLL